jgi:hypothetical protein
MWFVSATPKIHVGASPLGPPHLFLPVLEHYVTNSISFSQVRSMILRVYGNTISKALPVNCDRFGILWFVVFIIKCQALIFQEMCLSSRSPVSRCMAISVPHVSSRPLRTELNTTLGILTPGRILFVAIVCRALRTMKYSS